MKLRCTFAAVIASRLFEVGATYLAEKRKGSSIGAIDVVAGYKSADGVKKSVVLGAFEDEKTGDIHIQTEQGIAATFTRNVKSRFVTKEKQIKAKFDGTGQIDKRRFRRVCRQYLKLQRVNPAFTCPESHRQMQKLARFHRR